MATLPVLELDGCPWQLLCTVRNILWCFPPMHSSYADDSMEGGWEQLKSEPALLVLRIYKEN